MMHEYIERRLYLGVDEISEEECLLKDGPIIVLAEPGAGKTDLLGSFARKLGVECQRASIFRQKNVATGPQAVVIDALDEVARQDRSAVDAILFKASELGSAKVIFSSRSSEWGNERTRFTEDCFGSKPVEVRLREFDDREQKRFFENRFPDESFDAFATEVSRLGLLPVIANPMFLRLFVEGYIQAGRRFQSKRQIFKDAVDRLASDEKNDGPGRPPAAKIVAAASEIFAKLLLSGATGVSTVERLQDRDFPYISALSKHELSLLKATLDSQLFKPSADADCHEPVHRIVAEYCAARYLGNRVGDPSDRLSLRRCLAVVAPNGVIRDELRGLTGWLAAVSDKTVQTAAIELDPYAILANGDPAQLASTSKNRLLRKLREHATVDPYFRRSDIWRRFNASGFFTGDVVDELKLTLGAATDASHLTHLTLELVDGDDVVGALVPELRSLVVSPFRGLTTRLLAGRCLVQASGYDPEDDIQTLLAEDSLDALNVAAELIVEGSRRSPQPKSALELLRRLGVKRPADLREQNAGSRSFIKRFIESLELGQVVWLLDNLTSGLGCTCGAEKHYDCHCRDDVSKIVGRLLDRYFELDPGNHDPRQISSWTRDLKFSRRSSPNDSTAVKALRENDSLRRAIHLVTFGDQTDRDRIWELKCDLLWHDSHAGLGFASGDTEALVEHAFETNNPVLWSSFAPSHRVDIKERDPFRTKCRAQSRERPELMRLWGRTERGWREAIREHRWRPRGRNRWTRRNDRMRAANEKHLRDNRALIEQGGHWPWNRAFAHRYLHSPDTLTEIVRDPSIAETALGNCFNSVAPHTPTLRDLANGTGGAIAEVLHAGCLVRFRRGESLAGLDKNVLRAVRTDLVSSNTYKEGEAERFEAAMDEVIFQTDSDIENFAREFIEPTVANPEGGPSNLWWLQSKEVMSPVKAKLAREWIEQYPNASMHTVDTLFDICAHACDRAWLLGLIDRRCDEARSLDRSSNGEEQAARRRFWSLRHFYFAAEDRDDIWTSLLSDPDSIFDLERISGGSPRGEPRGWPPLNSNKIYRILDAYVEVWPKVFLPNHWGSGSPRNETAYRFLTDTVWGIDRDPPQTSVPVIDRITANSKFTEFHTVVRHLRAAAVRKQGLQDFVLPTPEDVVDLLDDNRLASVEDLRALLIDELYELQRWIGGADTDPIEMFWDKDGRHVAENTARNRIVERLQSRMTALDTSIVIEHHMADANRCDFTATAMIDGRRHLLVCEVKGQWHRELYSAAAHQLNEQYAIHPDAARQGVFLALWFGENELVAGRTRHEIKSAEELRKSICKEMPPDLLGFIDVVVLDLSKRPRRQDGHRTASVAGKTINKAR